MNIILIILFIIVVACIIDKKGYVSYEYGDNIPNYTTYTVDDTFPIVCVKNGDILLSMENEDDMIKYINDLKNTCNVDVDKLYFHCQNTNRYAEFDASNNTFRYVKLDYPPM